MDCRELLISWLNNAYAMEHSLIQVMEEHAEDANAYPELRKKIEDHIEVTESQADRVKSEIERLGGDVSEVKAKFAEAFGKFTGISAELAKDKVIKNAIADHASEHFEVATYLSIAIAARECGEEETEKMAREILAEEKTTGEELEEMMRIVVRQYIDQNVEE